MARLKHPSAATIVELMKKFVASIKSLDTQRLRDNGYTSEEEDDFAVTDAAVTAHVGLRAEEDMTPPEHRVRQFLTRIEGKLRLHPLWAKDAQHADTWAFTVNALGTVQHPARM